MSPGLVSPVLVGRQRELDRLRALLGQAVAGQPAQALLAGEAGVGKTRLCQELAAIATDAGVRVLSGACVELGGEGLSLAPLVDVLRAVARSTPVQDLPRCFGPALPEFARLLPELDPGATGGTRGTAFDGSATQLFEHVLALITRLASGRPLLLIVEDLHWADRSTRDLVAFLVRTLRDVGVLLVLTYRSDEMHRRHPLRPLIAGWERIRTVERIDVGRFSRAEVAAQLQAIRHATPPAPFLDVVYERSQGNAFLVEEILAAVEGGADPGELPPSLRDVLLARTETLSEVAQQVLRTASAAGLRIEDRLLEVVAGIPEAPLYAALREAVEHHLLAVDATGRGYAFRHALMRDALYEDMLPGELVRLHAAYGEALAADPGRLGDDSSVAATLAHHWYAALDLPRALEASVRAARQASAGYASAEALRHLERALQVWPRVPDAEQRAGLDLIALHVLAAEAALNAGDPGRGLSILDQLLAGIDPATGPVRRAHLVERRAFFLRALGRDKEAAQQLQDALALLPAEPLTTTHAVVLASLANSLARIGEDGMSIDVARRAVAVAAAVDAPTEQAEALITLGMTTAYLDEPEAGLAWMRDGLALAQRHDLHIAALRGHVNLSDALAMLSRHAEAADVARAGIEFAARVGRARSYGAILVSNLAESLFRLGRWREAKELITGALADDPSGVFASSLLLIRGEMHVWQGDLAAAQEDGRAVGRLLGSTTDPQFRGPLAFLEAEVARCHGDMTGARRHVQAALDQVVGFGGRYVWPVVWVGMRVEADLATTGTPPDGAQRAGLAALAAHLPAGVPSARAHHALVAGEAARLDGRDEVAAWQAAVAACRAMNEPFPLSYSLFRLAEAQSAGAPADPAAVATAQECLHLADELAAVVAGEVRNLARRARLRIEPPPAGASPSQPGLRSRLTDREREVLALVAEGHSNGQIATRLFISPKTASVHVSNILTKLDVSSRTEAATVAHRLGLID